MSKTVWGPDAFSSSTQDQVGANFNVPIPHILVVEQRGSTKFIRDEWPEPQALRSLPLSTGPAGLILDKVALQSRTLRRFSSMRMTTVRKLHLAFAASPCDTHVVVVIHSDVKGFAL
ncbi:hypothetical protein CVT25_012096 [Psilocybe cyanescens]|uniref:Uncharacterized protein n=1 Tax=Psilocybe cyanescens TaxID=93625 RepID=A0A409VMW1_PSICY|nr:hypothetical protein CVT25_012096 [Psilocybe cyanescens]